MEHTQLGPTPSLRTTSGQAKVDKTARESSQVNLGKQKQKQISVDLQRQTRLCFAFLSLLVSSLALCLAFNGPVCATEQAPNGPKNHHKQVTRDDQQQQQQRALEADLNSIVQQHDAVLGTGNDKWLAEAIISRLMVDNLTGSGSSGVDQQLDNTDFMSVGGDAQPGSDELSLADSMLTGSAALELAAAAAAAANSNQDQQQQQQQTYPSGAEAMRLRRLLSMLQNYETSIVNGGSGQTFAPFPLLPNSQAATMKRAAMRMGAYLQPRNSQAASAYGRDSFNFGLGKRVSGKQVGLVPAVSGILRFGDSLGGAGMQPVSQLGKRPSAHRFDFGLGKRVASPAYPTRYDFGLGKRAPNRIRYDFGLGK